MSKQQQQRPQAIALVDAREAVDLATAQTYSENVFLFLPNIIGATFHPFSLPTAHSSCLQAIPESYWSDFRCII